jgi:hypothetical protein
MLSPGQKAAAAFASVLAVLIIVGGGITMVTPTLAGRHTASDNGPLDSPDPGSSTVPSYLPSGPPTSPVPSTTDTCLDPTSLDEASGDCTPLSTASLLPTSITDSHGISYSQTSAEIRNCLDDDATSGVQNALRASGCHSMAVGTYLEENAKRDQEIMIDLVVIPVANSPKASSIYGRLKPYEPDDWGLWCPRTGDGSRDCDGDTGWTSARAWGYVGSFHRYVIHTLALYANMTSSSNVSPWVKAAAHAGWEAAGPQSFRGPDAG